MEKNYFWDEHDFKSWFEEMEKTRKEDWDEELEGEEFIPETEGMTDYFIHNGNIVHQITYIYSETQHGTIADDWKFISPKSGCAVSQAAAGDWSSKLLPYPVAASGQVNSLEDILDGLKVSQFFLERKVLTAFGMEQLPNARSRFIYLLEKKIRN